MPAAPYVLIFDSAAPSGKWLLKHLEQIRIPARWVTTPSELLAAAEEQMPVVCLFALRPPVPQALELLADLIQEPRFAHTAFVGVGSLHDKHAAFEAGADDYLITPPDIIELRKRVRLHLDRAALEARLVAETRITQEMEALSEQHNGESVTDDERVTLLEHVAELTREHDLYQTVLHSARSPIAFISPEGEAYYVNRAWECTFGPAETFRDTLGWPPHTDNPEVDRALEHAIAHATPWQGSAQLQTSEHTWAKMALALTPVGDAEGALYGYVLVTVDLSTQQMPRAVRAKLIADAITELRSPLSNLKVRHYLLQTAPPEQRPTHVRELGENIEHLTRVLDKISTLFHLEGASATFTTSPVDLNQLVQGVVARYQAQTSVRLLPARIVPYHNLPPVQANTNSLARALGLLLKCMIQHSPEDARITLEIGVSFTGERPFATVQLRNTPLPLQEETPFTPDAPDAPCPHWPRNTEPRMTLAIAQEIARLHKGMLTVAHGEEHGCAFTFWLPLYVPENNGENNTLTAKAP